jgi:hypothetical protein
VLDGIHQTNKSKTKMQTNEKFQLAETRNDLSSIILREMAPVATRHFSLPFQTNK